MRSGRGRTDDDECHTCGGDGICIECDGMGVLRLSGASCSKCRDGNGICTECDGTGDG